MPMRDAAPSPRKKPSEKLKAPGGKSKATVGSKCRNPAAMTTLAVRIVPIQSVTVMRAMDVMRR